MAILFRFLLMSRSALSSSTRLIKVARSVLSFSFGDTIEILCFYSASILVHVILLFLYLVHLQILVADTFLNLCQCICFYNISKIKIELYIDMFSAKASC